MRWSMRLGPVAEGRTQGSTTLRVRLGYWLGRGQVSFYRTMWFRSLLGPFIWFSCLLWGLAFKFRAFYTHLQKDAYRRTLWQEKIKDFSFHMRQKCRFDWSVFLVVFFYSFWLVNKVDSCADAYRWTLIDAQARENQRSFLPHVTKSVNFVNDFGHLFNAEF